MIAMKSTDTDDNGPVSVSTNMKSFGSRQEPVKDRQVGGGRASATDRQVYKPTYLWGPSGEGPGALIHHLCITCNLFAEL
ncbi:hypothetical protein NC652_018926 [Populus alba x Populus x berolinensis]|nr:hypothetical protein NC652_018926 [Populus alba x Populus x berolinensis]